MSANFDPYHAWLGIPRGSRPLNHYQLLGLKPFTSEPPVIAEAVETQKAKVQPHTQGGAAEAARLVLVELDNARKVLLNATARKAYDIQLRKQMGLPEPTVKGPATAARPVAAAAPAARVAPAAPVAAPRATPVGGTPVAAMPQAGMPQAAPMQAMPVAGYAQPMASAMPVAPAGMMPMTAQAPVLGGAALDPNSGAPMLRSGVVPRKRRKSGASAAVFILAGAILLLSGALTFAFRNELSAKLDEMLGTQTQQVVQTTPDTAQPKRVVVRTAPTTMNSSGERRYEDVADAQTPSEPPNEMAAKMGNALGNAFSETAPSVDMAAGPVEVRGNKVNQKARKATPGNATPSGMLGNIDPTFGATLPSSPASPAELEAVEKCLVAARTALGDRKLEEAQIQLDLARLEATSGQSLKAIERTRLLTEAVGQFWEAVRQGMKGLKAADEIKSGPSLAVVVDSSETKLAVRIEGKNREYMFDKLPRGIARSIAEKWLAKDDPNSKLILASFLAVDPNGDLEQAHKLVQTAANEGAGLEDLRAEIASIQR